MTQACNDILSKELSKAVIKTLKIKANTKLVEDNKKLRADLAEARKHIRRLRPLEKDYQKEMNTLKKERAHIRTACTKLTGTIENLERLCLLAILRNPMLLMLE